MRRTMLLLPDPTKVAVPFEQLLSSAMADRLAGMIDLWRAQIFRHSICRRTATRSIFCRDGFITLNRDMGERLWQRVKDHAGSAPNGMKRPPL